MKALDRAIERFCYKHPRFGIPRLMLYIIIGTAIVFLFDMMDRTNTLIYFLTFDPSQIIKGQVWRLVSWIFIPTGNRLFAQAITLYFYYFIGSTLESQWGTARFTIYYLMGVVLNIVFGVVLWLVDGATSFFGYSTIFTSYFLNMSMFFAFACLFPEHRVLFLFFIPIKIKWLALADALFFIYYIVVLPFPINLLPVVAVLNCLVFCADDLSRFFRQNKARASSAANFKREAQRAKQQQAHQPYRHKCAVCGKTDVDYPNLEFRYCSRCEGYHCFCMDHINSHVHFK